MAEKKETVEITGQNALQVMAQRLAVTPGQLKEVLKKTVCKVKEGPPITDVEFIGVVVVANEYRLNPLTKEIYAFRDRTGVIVPIVSTDGWNRLMMSHRDYSHHYYTYCDEEKTMPGAKPCPKWIEAHIVKTSGKEIVVREHLDECFRELKHTNPWQTHTKRMLRHKAKIQGAREAFGFGGIYDADEAGRIMEAEVVEEIPSKESSVQEKGKATEQTDPETIEMITDAQLKKIQAQYTTLKIKTHNEKMSYIKTVLSIEVESTKKLSKDQASILIEKQGEDIRMISKDPDPSVPEKCGPCSKIKGCQNIAVQTARELCDGPWDE